MAVGLQLILAVLQFRSFDFNDEVWDCGPVNVHDHDVGSFRRVGPKCDRVFDLDSVQGIFVVAVKATYPKLAHEFFRLRRAIFAGAEALQVGLLVLLE